MPFHGKEGVHRKKGIQVQRPSARRMSTGFPVQPSCNFYMKCLYKSVSCESSGVSKGLVTKGVPENPLAKIRTSCVCVCIFPSRAPARYVRGISGILPEP